MSDKSVVSASPIRAIDNAPLIVTLLLLVDSLHFVFARLLLPHLPPGTSALYVLGVATVELAVLTTIRGQVDFAVFRRNAWFFLVVGFLVAVSTTLNLFTFLSFTSEIVF